MARGRSVLVRAGFRYIPSRSSPHRVPPLPSMIATARSLRELITVLRGFYEPSKPKVKVDERHALRTVGQVHPACPPVVNLVRARAHALH